MQENSELNAYLKTVALISLHMALIFAFFNGIKSIAFTLVALLIMLNDVKVNITKKG